MIRMDVGSDMNWKNSQKCFRLDGNNDYGNLTLKFIITWIQISKFMEASIDHYTKWSSKWRHSLDIIWFNDAIKFTESGKC